MPRHSCTSAQPAVGGQHPTARPHRRCGAVGLVGVTGQAKRPQAVREDLSKSSDDSRGQTPAQVCGAGWPFTRS